VELVGCCVFSLAEVSLFSTRSSLLGGFVEITNKRRNIVLVFLSSLALRDVAHLSDEVLECTELLGANLLENVRHHVLKLLGLGIASHNEQVLSDRELDYTHEDQSLFSTYSGVS
jgi:hypothetical protein